MASNSNSTQLGCSSTSYKYTLSVEWYENETNIENNTTKIIASGSLSASNVGFDALYNSYACHLKLYWHDNNKNTDTLFATSSAFTTCGMGYGTRSVYGSITVTHKSDGSLSGYVKVYFDAPTTSGGWSPSSSSCNTEWTTCTTIARASSISGLSGNQLNSGVSVTIDRKSSSFTHKVEYKFVNSGWTTVSSNAATSCSFTPPLSLASQIPSAESGALTVRVTTYNGSTQIGSSVTKSINLSVPSTVVPSISGLTATRIDNVVPSSWGVYVKGISQVKITASGISGSYGSAITSCNINGQGLHVNEASGESSALSYSGKQTYSCMVIDSRGRYASKSVEINVVDYAYPTISVSAVRCKSDGTVSADGTYLKVKIDYAFSSVSGKNSITAKSCSCNGASNSSFASGTAFILSANCSIGNQYTLTASIKDGLGKIASMYVTIPTAYRVLNVKQDKKGIAIGKFSKKNAFEVNMDTFIYKGLSVDAGICAGNSSIIGYPIYGAAGAASWYKIGTWTSGGYAHACKITILTGNGYDGSDAQNTEIEVFIKNAWQSSPAPAYAFGGSYIVKYNYHNGVKFKLLATAHDTVDVWAYFPWEYWNGHYIFEGYGTFMHGADTNQSSEPSYGTYNEIINHTADYKGFPVNSIYITYNNDNPATFMGGTWNRVGEGRGLFSVGTSTDRNGYTKYVGHHEEFGYWKHTITVDEMPPHSHKLYARGGSTAQASSPFADNKPITQGSNAYGFNVSETGGGQSFFIVPPYLGVYYWLRVG